MNKLISILMPTRGRVNDLKDALSTLESTTINKERVEILIRCDSDDKDTIDFLSTVKMRIDTTVFIGERPPLKYEQLWLLHNELYKQSNGKFLFVFNDDCRMMTTGWDTLVGKYENDDCCILHIHTNAERTDDEFVFPIVHRTIPEIIGQFTLTTLVDRFYEELCVRCPEIYRKEFDINLYHTWETGLHVLESHSPFDPNILKDRELMEKIEEMAKQIRQYLWNKKI